MKGYQMAVVSGQQRLFRVGSRRIVRLHKNRSFRKPDISWPGLIPAKSRRCLTDSPEAGIAIA